MSLKELIKKLEQARYINHQGEENFINNDNMTVAIVSEENQHNRFPITFVDDDDSFFICIGVNFNI